MAAACEANAKEGTRQVKNDGAGQGFDHTKIKPGMKGDIAINAGIYKGRYLSRVEDVKSDAVVLACPLKKGILIPVYRDMNFTFTAEDGSALYIFEMAVRRIEVQGGIPLLWAVLVSEPTRIQRRQFVRVACLWDILVFQIETELKMPMSVTWKPARSLDISLRGTRFKLDDKTAGGLTFESGDRLMISFELDKEYFLLGRATRITHEDDIWEVGLSFDSVAISVEKKLFEYIRQQEIMGRE